MDEKLFKAIARKFPVMNVIDSRARFPKTITGTLQTRTVNKHIVELDIGISNVYILSVTPEEEDDKKERTD